LLNFEDSLRYLREITNIKDKVPNEVRTVLPIIDEVLNCFISNPTYTINNANDDKLNNTLKKMLEHFQHINLPVYLKFIILFLQQQYLHLLNLKIGISR